VGEGESQERQEREREGGQGLKYPSVKLSMIWLVRILRFIWLEVGAEGGFKLDLRRDRDPGKWKLKGAVRTETYRCHYCQQGGKSCLKVK
jgi:hypothetical protein